MVQRRQQQQWWSSRWQRVVGNKPRTTSATNNNGNSVTQDAVVTVVAPRAGSRASLEPFSQEQDTNAVELQDGEQSVEQNGQRPSACTRLIRNLHFSRFQWAILVMIIFTLTALVIIVPVLVVGKHRGDSVAPAQTQTLDYAYLHEIQTILGNESSLMEQWIHPMSPQLRATQLMAIQQPRIPLNSSRLHQRYALLTLYFANGGPWWNIDINPLEHECDWMVVECTPQEEQVVELHMHQLGMTSTLVSELGLLSLLTIADLGVNRLEGTIPTTLYQLTNLETLVLSTNRLSSTIDTAIGNLSKLSLLRFNANFFKGTLPSSIGLLTNLHTIAVDGNLFFGRELLENLPRWTKLEYLDFSDTDISGTIPTEIGLLTNLIKFDAVRTQLTGTLPSQVGLLENLVSLVIHESGGLFGTLPTTLGNLSSIQLFLLSELSLSGTIPTELAQLSSTLSYFSVSINLLTGTIPTQLGRLTNLQELYLNYNRVTGTVPSHLGNLSNLQRLSLFLTRLSGTMPLEICNLFEEGALVHLANSCEMVLCDCCTRCIVGTGEL